MRYRYYKILAVLLCICAVITLGPVCAMWVYPSSPEDIVGNPSARIGAFKYGQIYITETTVTGDNYVSATITKTADTKISMDLTLQSDLGSNVQVDITFYNATSVSYYYDKTETLSTSNTDIIYTVLGIEQKEEVPSGTYKTISLRFAYDGSVSASALLAELNFKFTVDKDSIGDLVAETAVDRFADVLNNVVASDSYEQLETAMNSRGTMFNKASAVTYIGNVVGADSEDSSIILSLFGEEFMMADLDGDGTEEPITMMIKRENLDSNTETGADYTYQGSWGNETTVQGVEMTIYITSQDIGNADIVVYAATYTRFSDASAWTLLVPLTKGTASTNNYSGWGSANSFNTDTWRSDSNQTIEDLVAEKLAN